MEALRLDFLEQGADESQLDFIIRVLKTQGYITRNFCLQRFISRLGARISDLKGMGYQIVGKNEKTHNGMDYRYTLITDRMIYTGRL
jgi:hypothetical protein